MSGMAGIYNYDTRDWVNEVRLQELASGIDRLGPDGGDEYLHRNVGMTYRGFWTTPESHKERQPLVSNGYVLTWDGRLDNREELADKIPVKSDAALGDSELVLAAYRAWGTACLPRLKGDWALAVWDSHLQILILARDYVGVRRLFYLVRDEGVAWCSIPEPLVVMSGAKLHLDTRFIAGCFYPRPPIDATPYLEIKSVVPAHFMKFGTGSRQAPQRYWSLNPHGKVRLASDRDYESEFRTLLRTSVRRRLRSDRVVTAELSGGVDSSSVVCVADLIRRAEPGLPVETLSYYDAAEPTGDERPYFSLIEEFRGRTGTHISMSEFSERAKGDAFRPLPDDCFRGLPGYFSRSLQWDLLLKGILNQSGSRVILSGLGGDEILGGVQYEAPELAEHLIEGRLGSLCHALYKWSISRKKPIPSLIQDVLKLFWAKYMPSSMMDRHELLCSWVKIRPSRDHLQLKSFAPWSQLTPVNVASEWVRYCLAAQLTCTDPPLVGCLEYRYPYLDRDLYQFVASIPRDQVLRSDRRRHLMRRALSEIVPHEILFRKTKWFGARSAFARLRDDKESIDRMFDTPWLSDGAIVDSADLRKLIPLIEHGAASDGLQVVSAIAIEQWLRSQTIQSRVDISVQ